MATMYSTTRPLMQIKVLSETWGHEGYGYRVEFWPCVRMCVHAHVAIHDVAGQAWISWSNRSWPTITEHWNQLASNIPYHFWSVLPSKSLPPVWVLGVGGGGVWRIVTWAKKYVITQLACFTWVASCTAQPIFYSFMACPHMHKRHIE